ncbi:hypothetical protein BDW67DRAFT_176798 [Aspergillus spinulosporus]
MDTIRKAFLGRPGSPLLSYGIPFCMAAARHVSEMFAASRVYVIVSKSLSSKTNSLQVLRSALKVKRVAIVGARVGMRLYTLWSEVLEIVAVRESSTDRTLTLGPSTLTDTAMVVSLALAKMHTTLLAGEYLNLAGTTEDSSLQKHLFGPLYKGPIWSFLTLLCTGVRAVNHHKTYFSLKNTTDETDALVLHLGNIHAVASITQDNPVNLGGSHGIGHQVGHGETNCILLPAACMYNARLSDNNAQLPIVCTLLHDRGQDLVTVYLADVLGTVTGELDMLLSLTDNSLKDWSCETNPVPLTTKNQLLEILELDV